MKKTTAYFVFALLALIGIGVAATLVLTLGAGSLFVITGSSGEQPTPIESYDPAPAGYQPVTVEQVEVEVGVGSPIPVHVIVSGWMPDPCSQVEYTEIRQDGSNFIITLSATPDVGGPAVDGCIKDPMFFKLGIPLNVVDLPAGSYSVTVNGSRADFQLDTANSTSSLPLRAADMPFDKADIQVDAVNVDIGRGSPLPIHAIVSANLPNACAQLGEVRVHRDGTTFFVRLVAYVPAQTDCNPDTLPMRVEVPLNIAYAPEGPYEVNVNGVTASFDHRTVPAELGAVQPNLIPIPVEHVGVQVGVGSPISVEIVASGTWPDLCSQISSVGSHSDGFKIDITVLSSTVEGCRPDNLGLPFRFAIPLNTVEMAEGTYTITVNGTSTTLDLPPSP